LDRYETVETIGFDYGQRHSVELECRPRIIARIRSEYRQWSGKLSDDHVVPLSSIKHIGGTALTGQMAISMGANGLPTTFVPGRNVLFLTVSAALAYRRDIRVLVGGMCETDYSGYPDCRDDTLKAMQVALGLAMESRFVIETPLMWIDKAATWRLAEKLGGKDLVRLIIEETHSCYKGVRQTQHEWGHGCGECPACELRSKGYVRYRKTNT
jgi:7-cyano-7-deazaguanine synthase